MSLSSETFVGRSIRLTRADFTVGGRAVFLSATGRSWVRVRMSTGSKPRACPVTEEHLRGGDIVFYNPSDDLAISSHVVQIPEYDFPHPPTVQL